MGKWDEKMRKTHFPIAKLNSSNGHPTRANGLNSGQRLFYIVMAELNGNCGIGKDSWMWRFGR